jgi:acetylornithine/N-succinyldiaminopimelate aminotransferase
MSYLAKNYNRKKISFKYGKEAFYIQLMEKKYLDFVQGIAVNSLGHAHPKLVDAVKKQSKKLWHVSNAFQIPEGEMLAKKLAKKTFADYVMFQNSGAEATEGSNKSCKKIFLFNWKT